MTETTALDKLTVNVKELLKFFDEKHGASKGDATGIVAVTGEDLNAACFQHYSESRGDQVTILSGSVTTGKQKGPWLDRWLLVKPHKGRRFLYQTEIKNWSAFAIGGQTLAVNATAQDVADYKQRRWERHWDIERQSLKGPSTAKVLVPMNRPSAYKKTPVKPLLIFWEALGPKEIANDHLFTIPVTYYSKDDRPASWPPNGKFEDLWVFSVSSYLRSLAEDHIQLPMPNAAQRLQILNNLFLTGW